jgi:hypothetical protein
MASEHTHNWRLPEGGFIVIDTLPEQLPYHCECGAFTHDPATGDPCPICAPGALEEPRRQIKER